MEKDTNTLKYKFANGASAKNIPFELNTNKPYLQVRVNDSGPYWFMLDTGSVSTVVDRDVATVLGLEAGESFQASGAGEKTLTGSTGNGVALSLPGLEIATGPIDILPISKAIAFSEGRRVDGLLGYDFFASFIVAIDYANQQLSLYDRHSTLPAVTGMAATLPLDIVRGNPFVSAELVARTGKTLSGRFLVDTGWRSAISLNAPFVARHNLIASTPIIEAVTGVGIGGPTVEPVGRIETLQLGSLAIVQPVTNFSRAKAGILSQSDMAGIIGGEILRRYEVIFDYPHGQLILATGPSSGEPYEFDMCGIMAAAEGNDFKTLRIYHVTEGSPADEAGLQKGDVMVAIDDQPAAQMSVEHVRRLFRRGPGTEHKITVLRNSHTITVGVTLRRLV